MLQKAGKMFRRSLIFTGRLIHGKPKDSTATLSRNHVIEES